MQFIKINKLEIKAKDVTSLGYSPWNQEFLCMMGRKKERKE
jgi:hypothetical protein